jgi:hypothetical protein
MSYSNFTFDDKYEASPEFSSYAVPQSHTESSDWMLAAFYWTVLVASMITVITSVGVIYTRLTATGWKSDTAETNTIVFEVFAWITLFAAFVMFIMSILALSYKMGYSALAKKFTSSWSTGGSTIRANEKRQELGVQEAEIMSRAGQSSLGNYGSYSSNPYANMG